MKKVALVIFRDKFTDGLISWFETFYSDEYEFVIITNKGNGQFLLSEHKSPIIEVDYPREAFKEPNIDVLLSADAVIMSGFFYNPPKHIKNEKELFSKLWIDFWGGDYTCFRLRYIKDGVYMYLERYKRKMKFIRNCRGWINEMDGENLEIMRRSLINKPSITAPVLSPEEVEEREMFITKVHEDGESLKILLGNSAARENDHIKILKRLSHLKNENIQIFCPLSYGDDKNAEKVKAAGKRIWGDKFIPLMDYMPKSEYYDMLHSIDVAIYNNNRPQGTCNIEEMLRQGKKVYLRKTTPMWKWYIGRGENVYTTESLRFITKEKLAYFPKELAEANIEVDRELRRTKWAVRQWKKVLDTATNS